MVFIKKFYSVGYLKSRYVAEGRFYWLNIPNFKPLKCRSELDIKRVGCEFNTKYDAIFIMMNPGGSKIVDPIIVPNYTPTQIKNGQHLKSMLIPTIPDKTQYQIMRLMEAKGWNFAKVINLSDIRQPTSKDFYEMIKKLVNYDIHSIFSKDRVHELMNILSNIQETEIIVAWGVSTKLRNLIDLALKNKTLSKRKGLPKKYVRKKNYYYYHPLPRRIISQILWYETMLKII